MFRKVDHDKLKYNQTYKINNGYKGIYKGIVWMSLVNPYRDGWNLEFEYIRTLENEPAITPYYFTPRNSFYEFISQKEYIQRTMEQRALDIILRRLIGDETFTW